MPKITPKAKTKKPKAPEPAKPPPIPAQRLVSMAVQVVAARHIIQGLSQECREQSWAFLTPAMDLAQRNLEALETLLTDLGRRHYYQTPWPVIVAPERTDLKRITY